MKPAPPTPIDTKRAEIGGPMWDPAWDKIVEEALPPELLSPEVGRDVRPFCPRFASMGEADKRAFWAYFFQALAGAEAGLKPTSNVRHCAAGDGGEGQVTGVQGRTEGLLQLAYADQKRYGCDFDWEADRRLKAGDPARTILQPKNNLECGVKILDQELIAPAQAAAVADRILVDAAAGDGELSRLCEADGECARGMRHADGGAAPGATA